MKQSIVIEILKYEICNIEGYICINQYYKFHFFLKKMKRNNYILTISDEGKNKNEIAIWSFPKKFTDNDYKNRKIFKWLAINAKQLMLVVSPRI